MNKITIIALFLAVSSTVIFTELALQDYLGKVYPSYQKEITAKATSSFQNLEELFKSDGQQPQQGTQPQASQKEVNPQLSGSLLVLPDSPKQGNETTKTKAEPAQEKVFQQNYLSSLLAVKLSPQKFNQQLFQLIQIDSPEITGSNQLVYKDQDRVLISLSEIDMSSESAAQNYLIELKALAESLPEITTNQTDSFFEKSFYLNHKSKVDQVYLIGQKDNKILAMYYYKNFHPSLKVNFGQ